MSSLSPEMVTSVVIQVLRTLLPRDHVPRLSDRLIDDLELPSDDGTVLLLDVQRKLKLCLSDDAVQSVFTVQDLIDALWQTAQTKR